MRQAIYETKGRAKEFVMKLCNCGCGQPTNIILKTDKRYGYIKGEYHDYIRGHNTKDTPKTLEHRRKLSESRKANPSRYWLGKKMPEYARQAMRGKRKPLTTEHKLKLSIVHKQRLTNELERMKCATWNGRRHTKEELLKMSKAQKGEKGSNWKGGISPINERLRQSLKSKQWRLSILKRDKFTCKVCGASNGNGHHINLIPHHIKRFADYPELRFNINNGITLCSNCHKPTIKHEAEYEKLFKQLL